MKFKILLSILICLNTLVATAQLTGKVYDKQTKEPIVGATIHLNNGESIAQTNNDGHFECTVDNDASLTISAVGYKSQTVITTGNKCFVQLETDQKNLQAIIVTANREASKRAEAPIAISKLSPKLIDETKASSVYEVINKTPGVFMADLGNEQHMMSIRQPITTNAYYLYLEDGVPIRPMGVFNHNALLEVNQFAISSIEVVKGPVSSIYGPEAVGGAINFIMQRPTAVPTAKAGIQFDNWGFRRIQFGTGATIGKFGFYVAGLSSKQTNSWMASSDYDKTAINARLEYHINAKTHLFGNFTYGKYNSQMGGSTDSIAFYGRQYTSTADFTYRLSDANRSTLSLQHNWNDNAKTTITLFNRNDKMGQNPSYGIKWTSPNTTAKGEINENSFKSYGVMAQHSQNFDWLSSKLIAGATFDYSPNTYWSYQIDLNAKLRGDGKSVEQYTILQERPDIKLADYKAKIKNSAAYVQYDASPVKNLRLSAGLRYDRMFFSYVNRLDVSAGDKSYSQFTPKVGATYQISQNIGAYTNFATGFAPPALTAIFRKRPNTTPVDFYYNLKPAQFNNVEVGAWASLLDGKVYTDIALYQMNGKNELLNIRQPDNSYDYQSAGKTLHRGIELGLTYKPITSINFRFGATLAEHRFKDFQISNQANAIQKLDDLQMPSAPNWIVNSEVAYYPCFLPNFRLAAEWQHLSDYYQNQINTVKYKGYHLVNCRVGYQWRGIEVYANVMNATDALYATNATRGNNASDRTTFTAAAPRTYVFGLQYNFVGKH
jgi:iron complex outermembrane receptor protein